MTNILITQDNFPKKDEEEDDSKIQGLNKN